MSEYFKEASARVLRQPADVLMNLGRLGQRPRLVPELANPPTEQHVVDDSPTNAERGRDLFRLRPAIQAIQAIQANVIEKLFSEVD